MSAVHFYDTVAFLEDHGTSVFFSKTEKGAGASPSKRTGTSAVVKEIENTLRIAYWGEDNRFPQNIENQMAYCGIGLAALEWKARALYGGGIIPGKVNGFDPKAKAEIFEPLDRIKYKHIYAFINSGNFFRFMIEYLQDWVWFSNTFPEALFSNDCSEITGWVHQESCDCRYQQMDKQGNIKKVFISKLWGAAQNQYVKFDPQKKMKGIVENPTDPCLVENEFIKEVDCADMYNAVESLKEIAEKLSKTKKDGDLKSAILPNNYPSVNKTYYQKASWDGARLAGWIEISCKIPGMLKVLYEKAFNIRFHLEIPDTYFEDLYGFEVWESMDEAAQQAAKKKLLKDLTNFLSGAENAHKAFVSFFKTDKHKQKEYGQVKITAIDDKTSLDKEFLTQSAADLQFLNAAGVHPTLFGAGTIGTGSQRSGGSDMREAFLIYNATLTLERKVVLQPLYVTRDFNGWDDDIEFRIIDTVLTTLDQNTGTEKKLS